MHLYGIGLCKLDAAVSQGSGARGGAPKGIRPGGFDEWQPIPKIHPKTLLRMKLRRQLSLHRLFTRQGWHPDQVGRWSGGDALTFEEAVHRRRGGEDIVVRGDDLAGNRRLAGQVEAAVGPATRPQPPHTYSAGPHALPHFHQLSRSPDGHSFCETKNRKARRQR